MAAGYVASDERNTDMVGSTVWGVFAEFRTTAINFVMSVCPSAHPHGFHWWEFHEISYLSIIRKSIEKIQVSLKSDKNNEQFS